MALDFVMEYLPEVSHVDHLTTVFAGIKMISLVLRLAAKSVADDLTWLDH